VIKDKKKFSDEERVLNYVYKHIEIKMSPGKGRGLFATKPIKRGQLVIVERAIAQGM